MNYIACKDPALRFVGRWHITEERAIATAEGAHFYLGFRGTWARLHFEIQGMTLPHPHLWIRIDDGAAVEVPIDKFIRLEAEDGDHVVQVVYKSAVLMAQRWFPPLDGRIEFLGCETDAGIPLPSSGKKTIEFVGDSITEGVLADEALGEGLGIYGRPYQDDVTASYAWLTARKLGLEPLMMGYGSVGATKSGCGDVPKAATAYPYCFDGAPIPYRNPDSILVCHGANDKKSSRQQFLEAYRQLLTVIANHNPQSRLILLAPFCGVWGAEIAELGAWFSANYPNPVHVIPTDGWTEPEPLHPSRETHKLLAEKLTAAWLEMGI